MFNICSYIAKNIVNEFLVIKKYSNYKSFAAIGFVALSCNALTYINTGRITLSDIEDLCDETLGHYRHLVPYGQAVLNDLVFNQIVLYNQIDGNMRYDDARQYVESQILNIINTVEATYMNNNPGFLKTKGVKNYLSFSSTSNVYRIADRFEKEYPKPDSYFSD